jgi:hypothetical protein
MPERRPANLLNFNQMKKLSLVFLFISLFSVASFAGSKTSGKHIAQKHMVKKAKVFFPVSFQTSCGTWTGDADCGSLSTIDCIGFLNAVGDFLESLCAV